MTLQASGPISIDDINIELSESSGTTTGIGDAAPRGLADVASGPISMSDFYGASAATAGFNDLWTITGGTSSTDPVDSQDCVLRSGLGFVLATIVPRSPDGVTKYQSGLTERYIQVRVVVTQSTDNVEITVAGDSDTANNIIANSDIAALDATYEERYAYIDTLGWTSTQIDQVSIRQQSGFNVWCTAVEWSATN